MFGESRRRRRTGLAWRWHWRHAWRRTRICSAAARGARSRLPSDRNGQSRSTMRASRSSMGARRSSVCRSNARTLRHSRVVVAVRNSRDLLAPRYFKGGLGSNVV